MHALCGSHPWALGLALGLAIILMFATRMVHAPAGSNPVIVFLTAPVSAHAIASRVETEREK